MDLASRDLKKRVIKIVIAIIAGSLIISAATIGFFLNSGYAIFIVSGSSMTPSLQDRNTIIVKSEESLQRGQIAILKKPAAWEHTSGLKPTNLVKRIAAIPGDTIAFDGESFFVNGNSVYDLDTINYECKDGIVGYEHTLSDQEVFILGDNAKGSLDSRRMFCDGKAEISLVPYENLIDYGNIAIKF